MAQGEYACRFYEPELPEIDECVMVQVTRIEPTAVYCKLTEYNNVEGMVQLAELSKRRIRSVAKLVRVGKFEVMSVVRVDPERNHLDLSKRRVAKDDLERCQLRFSQAKMVHTIVRHCAAKLGVTVTEMSQKVSWVLDREHKSAFEGMKLFAQDGIDVFSKLQIPKEWVAVLSQQVSHRLISQPVRLTSHIDVRCVTYEGVEAIKKTLTAGFAVAEPLREEDRAHREMVLKNEEADRHAKGIDPMVDAEHIPLRQELRTINIRLIAPPVYLISTSAFDRFEGVKTLDRVIDAIAAAAATNDCSFSVKTKPEVVADETDDEEVAVESVDDSNSNEPDEEDDTMGAVLV